MRRLSLLGAVAAVAVALALPAAAGNPPDRFVFVDDVTFPSGFLTAACGTPVFISLNGTLQVTLRTGPDGILHEKDIYENWTFTLSAPDYDTSISYKFGPSFFEYPDGVYIGAPSIVTFLGMDSNVPGLHAVAGRTVMAGEVIDITPEGIPVVDPFATISEVGNQVDQAIVRAAICAALTG
jgi:hypothetical protein